MRAGQFASLLMFVVCLANLIVCSSNISAGDAKSIVATGSIVGNGYVIYKEAGLTKARKITATDPDFSNPDSSKVINGAITRLVNGGMILISEGYYMLSSTIYLASNIIFQGSGVDVTFLRLRDNATSSPGDMLRGGRLPYELHDGVDNVKILDMTMDGNRANNLYQGVWNRQNPIYFQWSSNITIERMKIYNGTCINVHLDTCNNVLLRNLSLYNAGWDGVHLGNLDDDGVYSNNNITIEDVHCEDLIGYPSTEHSSGWTGGSGLDIGKSTNVEIRRVKVINTGAKGIYLDQVSGAIVDNCEVENTNMEEQTGAYTISKSTNARLTNCTSRNSRARGVEIVASCNGEIAKNTILEPELDGITVWRSALMSVSENFLNKTKASDFGIEVTASADIETKLNVVVGFRHSLGLRDDGNLTISENDLTEAARSSIYIFLNCSNIKIHYNDIVRSESFPCAIYNENVDFPVHAEDNWWGTADRTQIMNIVPANQSIIWEPFSQSQHTLNHS